MARTVCVDNGDVTVVRRVGEMPTVGSPIDVEPGVLGVLASTHESTVSKGSNVDNVKAVVRVMRQTTVDPPAHAQIG